MRLMRDSKRNSASEKRIFLLSVNKDNYELRISGNWKEAKNARHSRGISMMLSFKFSKWFIAFEMTAKVWCKFSEHFSCISALKSWETQSLERSQDRRACLFSCEFLTNTLRMSSRLVRIIGSWKLLTTSECRFLNHSHTETVLGCMIYVCESDSRFSSPGKNLTENKLNWLPWSGFPENIWKSCVTKLHKTAILLIQSYMNKLSRMGAISWWGLHAA